MTPKGIRHDDAPSSTGCKLPIAMPRQLLFSVQDASAAMKELQFREPLPNEESQMDGLAGKMGKEKRAADNPLCAGRPTFLNFSPVVEDKQI
ncbi:MAG TPA: hypothetical protein VKU02_15235 [Gemmataceae bacterium]|nr:hypothetical protein [Gemmataceae bacterium]